MTTQQYDLSAHAITTGFEEDAERKLALVREQITEADARLADLRRSEEVLVRILKGLRQDRPEGAASEQPSTSTQPMMGEDDQAASAAPARPAAELAPGLGRRAPRSKEATKQPPKTTARRATSAAPSRRGSAPSEPGEATLPERVVEFLLANPGPQKAAEITTGLFGSSAPPARAAQVRTTAERLVKRGQVDKERQGTTVFYQHVGTQGLAEDAQDGVEA